MASAPATGTFKKRAPGILFFFPYSSCRSVFWLDLLDGRLEFSRAYARDKIDFRVYSIKRRGVYYFFHRSIWFPHGPLLKGGVFLIGIKFVEFCNPVLCEGADRESMF